jgi:hypothetical protein
MNGTRTRLLGVALAAAAGIGCRTAAPSASTVGTSPDPVRWAAEIRRADYEGNRAELQRLFEESRVGTADPRVDSRVRYWRGFAMWRRALNGFNENADKEDLKRDLATGIAEFEAALAAEPGFTDAKVGLASCAVNRAILLAGPDRLAGYKRQWDLLGEAQKEAPENPRLAWVLGAAQYYAPPPQGGQEKALATYEQGLRFSRQERSGDPLDPAWGEPELLMNLAFANLSRKAPDLDAADRFAHEALAKVPYWHYVRDILIPQIAAARAKAATKG